MGDNIWERKAAYGTQGNYVKGTVKNNDDFRLPDYNKLSHGTSSTHSRKQGENGKNYLIKCPDCGKKQSHLREKCIDCNFNFRRYRENIVHEYKTQVDNKIFNISDVNVSSYIRNNYFKFPDSLPKDNDELVKQVTKSIKSYQKNSNVLFISKNSKIINKIKENLKNEVLLVYPKNESPFFKLIEYINQFEKVNAYLFKEYSVKIGNDIKSTNLIPDLKIFEQNVSNIEKRDINALNNFLMLYWNYWELYNSVSIDITQYRDRLQNQANKLIAFKNNMIKFDQIFEFLELSNLNQMEKISFIGNIDILNKNPCLINSEESDNFVKLLNEYDRLNKSHQSSFDLFSKFDNKNYILQCYGFISNHFKINEKYQLINDKISGLKNKLKEFGFYITNLNEFYNLKNKNFHNAIYIDDINFVQLNNKLKIFIPKKTSFSNIFNRCKDETIKLIENSISIDDYQYLKELNENIFKIKEISSKIGINIDSLRKLDENRFNIEILLHKPNLINKSKRDLINQLNDFYSTHKVKSIDEYAYILFNSLKSDIYKIFSRFNNHFNEKSKLEYVNYNIDIVIEVTKKMGINYNSLHGLKKNLPKINYLANIDKSFKKFNEYEFEKYYDLGLFTDKTLEYIDENSESDIWEDVNKLDVAVKSIIFELKGEKDYSLRVSWSNLSKKEIQDNYKLKDEILNLINSINSVDMLMEKYDDLFKYCFEFLEKYNLDNFRDDLNKLYEKFAHISSIYDHDDYLSIYDSWNYLQFLNNSEKVNQKFTDLYDEKFFNNETIAFLENDNVKNEVDSLFAIGNLIKETLIEKDQYDIKFDEIINSNENIKKDIELTNQKKIKILKDIKNSTIVNFDGIYAEIKDNFDLNIKNELLSDYNLVKEILDLASKLKYDDIYEYSFEKIRDLSVYMNNSVEFSDFVKKGKLDKNANVNIEDKFSELDSLINSIKEDLGQLDLDSSSLIYLSEIEITDFIKYKSEFDRINEITNKSSDIDEKLKNKQEIINILNTLFDNYNLKVNGDYSASILQEKLNNLNEELNNICEIRKIEKEILSHGDLINNNLANIWNSPSVNMDNIINKFNIDKEYTELVNKGSFSKQTIDNIGKISSKDLNFIKEFSHYMLENNYHLNLMHTFENNVELISEINKLENINSDDFEKYHDIFKEINNILKINDLTDTIQLLEKTVNQKKLIEKLDDYKQKLNSYSLLCYKYFKKRPEELTIDELIKSFNSSLKLMELIDKGFIEESKLLYIGKNSKDYLNNIEKLEGIREKLIECVDICNSSFPKYKLSNNLYYLDFKTMKKMCKRVIESSNVYLLNLSQLDQILKDSFLGFFDIVMCHDHGLSEKDKFKLFLLSNDKIILLKYVWGS